MNIQEDILDKAPDLLPYHKQIDGYGYNKVVEWAIQLISKNIENTNLLIISSFSNHPIATEIQPYVSLALEELKIEELELESANLATCYYYTLQISKGVELKKNLTQLIEYSFSNGYLELGLDNLYSLYHAWDSLEIDGSNYYYEGCTLENIRAIVKEEAKLWIAINVLHKPENETDLELNIVQLLRKPERSLFSKIKFFFSGKY